MKIFRKETEAEKVTKEIESIAFKKEVMLSALVNEKNMQEENREKKLCEIGEIIYEQYGTEKELPDLKEKVEKIREIEKEIQYKNQKMEEITKRYDEEIDLLRSTIRAQEVIVKEKKKEKGKEGEQVYCSNCGQMADSEDVFCQNCGNKI